MAGTSAIAWTDKTWNPTTGCTRVSPGCDHCYAFALHDKRYIAKKAGKAVVGAQYDVPFSTVQMLGDERLEEPLHWRKPVRVFVDSMSDLFHEDVTDEFLDRVFAVMALTPHITYQVLTKRPERMRRHLRERDITIEAVDWAMERIALVPAEHLASIRAWAEGDAPLPNLWLGVSVEDQERADERIPILLDTPAAVRFISAEPLLGPIEFSDVSGRSDAVEQLGRRALAGIDWVIVGGESGAHARAFDLAWARSLREQCQAAGVACFVKQIGRSPVEERFTSEGRSLGRSPYRPGTRLDPHGADMDEWPADLQVREFPRVGEAVEA